MQGLQALGVSVDPMDAPDITLVNSGGQIYVFESRSVVYGASGSESNA